MKKISIDLKSISKNDYLQNEDYKEKYDFELKHEKKILKYL